MKSLLLYKSLFLKEAEITISSVSRLISLWYSINITNLKKGEVMSGWEILIVVAIIYWIAQ